METDRRGKPPEISADHLVRNYLALVHHPFTEEEFTLTMYRICLRLHESGLKPTVGFRGDPENPGSLGNELYSPSIADEFSYWAGHRFLEWHQEQQRWYLPRRKQERFIKDLGWVNAKFPAEVRAMLNQTIQEVERELHGAQGTGETDL